MSELGLQPMSDRSMVRKIGDFCNSLVQSATQSSNPIRKFPGTMALSLSRRHRHMIASHDYVALEKSDGMRYMLLTLPTSVVLIDRRMNVFEVNPNPYIPVYGNMNQLQKNTLLDGELTHNIALNCWEYLIYDAVVIDDDVSVARMDFRERLQAVEKYVAAPRVFLPMMSGLLRLRVKDYYEKSELRDLFNHIKKNAEGEYVYTNHRRRDGLVCNLNDGVIFTPCKLPYTVSNCDSLLKWKPPELNSVDFQLQLERAVDPRTNLPSVRTFIAFKGEKGNVRQREVFLSRTHKRMFAESFNEHNNSIVELSYDKSAGDWRYIRTREDKDTPNFSRTVIDTMESIAESWDREALVAFLEARSEPTPSEKDSIVQDRVAERAKCTYVNDLFDESNHEFSVATPISRLPPPMMAPRAYGGRRRGGGFNAGADRGFNGGRGGRGGGGSWRGGDGRNGERGGGAGSDYGQGYQAPNGNADAAGGEEEGPAAYDTDI